MGMGIDEARREHASVRLDDAISAPACQLAHRHDPAAGDRRPRGVAIRRFRRPPWRAGTTALPPLAGLPSCFPCLPPFTGAPRSRPSRFARRYSAIQNISPATTREAGPMQQSFHAKSRHPDHAAIVRHAPHLWTPSPRCASSSASSAQLQAVRHLLDHPSEVPLLSMRKIAADAGVPATLRAWRSIWAMTAGKACGGLRRGPPCGPQPYATRTKAGA